MTKSIVIGDVEVTWLGHASFMFKSDGTVVYIDPYKVSHGEKADLILVTHDHYDHCDPGSISMIRKEDTVIVAPESCKDKLGKINSIKSGQSMEKCGVGIIAVPAYNVSKQYHPHGGGFGYVVTIGEKKIYHAGDTDNIPEMSELGDIDMALLPVGGTYTMNPEEAADAAEKIGAEITVPMHWGGIVGTRKDAEEFKKLAKARVEIMD